MELWKSAIITCLSVIIVETVLSVAYEPNYEGTLGDEVDAVAKQVQTEQIGGLLQRWKAKRTSTITPATTISPGSLADLNARIQALQTQVASIQNQVLAEEAQINNIEQNLQTMNSVLAIIYNLLVPTNG